MAMLHVAMVPHNLERGRQLDCAHCPVALATTRALRVHNLSLSAEAAYLGITIFDQARFQRWTVPTPAKVSIWMRDFDNGRQVAPIEFDLPIPDEVLTP